MRTRLLVTLALVCCPAFVRHAPAQRGAECATLDCPGAASQAGHVDPLLPQAWQAAADTHQRKLVFVAALQRFTRAQAGTFGDEAAELAASIGAMRLALTQWDAAIRALDAMLAARPPGADIHVVRATVYLDRHRVDDAVRELLEAGRFDPERVDVHTLQALAFDLDRRPSDALRALRRAADRDAANPVIAYMLAQRAFESGEHVEASRALERVSRALDQSKTSPVAGAAAVIAPFERVDLLRQSAGIAPIFVLASYADGYTALIQGDFLSAIAHFERAASQDRMVHGAMEARAQVTRGAAALRAGQVRAAIRILDDGARQSPDHAETHRILSLAYRIDEQWDLAVDHASGAARLSPDERTRLGLAEALLSADRVDEAARVLDAVARDWPRSGTAHYRLGELHERGGRVEAALAAYRRARDLEPIVGRDHLYLAIARLAANQADFDGTAEAHAARIAINPNHAEAHRQLAEVYFLQGRHDEALAEFSVAAWLDGANARAHAGRGHVYVRTRRFPEAVAAFERAVALGSDDPETHYGLGTALVRTGRRPDGESHLAESARRRAAAAEAGQLSFRIDALRREAARRLREGEAEAALAAYREVLEASPGDARSHRDVGLTLAAAGKPSEAIPFLETAQASEPVAESALVLADAYASTGKIIEREQQLVRHAQLVERRKLEKLKLLTGAP
jgi:tetratricopeptide (TPR) repeat protein